MKLLGTINPEQITEEEAQGAEWHPLAEAIKIFEQEDPEAYEGKFMSKSDLLFLKSCYNKI